MSWPELSAVIDQHSRKVKGNHVNPNRLLESFDDVAYRDDPKASEHFRRVVRDRERATGNEFADWFVSAQEAINGESFSFSI